MAKTPKQQGPLSGSQHGDASKVPVITLNHNPSGRSDHPKVGKARGKTVLPMDTAGYGSRQTGPSSKQKTR